MNTVTLPGFVATPTRFLFFTGKGGVGKTSLSTATAIALADAGQRVLLVSTDAASNLDDMLGITLSNQPVEVPGVPGLSVINIDPDAAAEAYRLRVLAQLDANATEADRNRALGKRREVEAGIGRNARHLAADEDAERKVVALGSLGRLDLAETDADALGARAHHDGIRLLRTRLQGQLDQLFGTFEEIGGIDLIGHGLAFPSRSIYCACEGASRVDRAFPFTSPA